jgi:hypothetical protein
MSLHRFRFDDADWRPHPFALAVYVAGVALLAWSAYVYAQTPSGQGGAGPRAEPWRPAASKWSRALATDGQRISTASTSAYGALPTAAAPPPLPQAAK